MSNHQQQSHPAAGHQMPMQRMMAARPSFPTYGMRQQVPMQPGMSQQTRYVIPRPPPNNQTPPNTQQQQLHSSPPNMIQNQILRQDGTPVSMPSGSQIYHNQQSSQNPQMMHQMNRGPQQIQMMQQQGTPPNQQNYNSSSPYTPPTPQQQQYPNQHQMDQRHYNQQPTTPQDRQIHQRIQQQGMQRPLTPQQQHAQSPIQRKNPGGMVKSNSQQNLNEGMSQGHDQQQQQQHYVVQTSVPSSMYSGGQSQVVHQVGDNQQDSNYNNTIVVSQQGNQNNNFQIRHPMTNRPLRFTNQPNNPPIVRYSYPGGQQNQQVVIQPIHQQQPRVIRPNQGGEYRQQYVQVIRSESDATSGQPTYRMPASNNDQSYTQQQNVFYRSTAPPQHNSAIRQALGHENSYQQQPMSQSPVVIQSIENPNGQVMFKMQNSSIQRQISSDNSDGYMPVQSVVEATVADFAEQSTNRNTPTLNDENQTLDTSDEASPKKAKLTPKSGKTVAVPVSKQIKSKSRKAPTKSIANKTISTTGMNSEMFDDNSTNSNKSIITKNMLEQTAKSISSTLTLEEDAKTGVIMYMENFINRLIQETGRATNLRQSKQIQNKDIEYALRTKFNINPVNSETASIAAAKFAK